MNTNFIRKIFGRLRNFPKSNELYTRHNEHISYKAEMTELRTILLSAEDPACRDSEFSKKLEAMIDQTLADSFPASDPPAWTLGREPSILNVS